MGNGEPPCGPSLLRFTESAVPPSLRAGPSHTVFSLALELGFPRTAPYPRNFLRQPQLLSPL